MMQKLLRVISAPAACAPGLLAAMVMMLTVVPGYYYLLLKPQVVGPHIVEAAAAMLSEAVIVAWLLTGISLLLRRLSRIAATVWTVAVFVVLGANWLVDLALMLIYRCSFTEDIAGVIAATNLSEGANFIAAYVNGPFLAWAAGSLALIAAVGAAMAAFRKRMRVSPRTVTVLRIAAVAVLAGAIGCRVTARDSITLRTNLRGKLLTCSRINLGADIVACGLPAQQPGPDAPQKIVVIIGESLTRDHCSLYGYPLSTQPHLEAMRAGGELIVYADPSAPACHTMAAFQRFIGTWDGSPSTAWFEQPTWIELARSAGYHTSWISNQAGKGVYDNPVVKIARFCDRSRFTNDGMRGIASARLDEAVIPLVSEWLDSATRELTVIHLMGNHVSYSRRYPAAFKRFSAADYPDLPEKQRATVAEYDNSVAYNDSIVAALMRLYDGTDAAVFYFPDHAQDLYQSSPSHFGHSKPGDAASEEFGLRIPMMVHLTPTFRRLHPAAEAALTDSAAAPYSTSQFIHTVGFLLGVKLFRPQ